MAQARKPQTVGRWTGVSAILLVLVAWGLSLRWEMGFIPPGGGFGCALHDGCIFFAWVEAGKGTHHGWFVGASWTHTGGLVWPSVEETPGIASFSLPLWILLVAMIVTTVPLFVSALRPISADHCRSCGCDLTGNVSGKCPECGQLLGRDPPHAG